MLLLLSLSSCLEFSLKRLKSPVVRNTESLACLRSKIIALRCVNIKHLGRIKDENISASLRNGIYLLLRFLVDRSHKLTLELLEVLLYSLFEFLDSCLDLRKLILLALPYSRSP